MALGSIIDPRTFRAGQSEIAVIGSLFEYMSRVGNDQRQQLIEQIISIIAPDEMQQGRFASAIQAIIPDYAVARLDGIASPAQIREGGRLNTVLMGVLEYTASVTGDQRQRIIDELIATVAPDQARQTALLASLMAFMDPTS
jgi:ketopantoate reductase